MRVLDGLASLLVDESHLEALVQVALGLEHVADDLGVEAELGPEDLSIGAEEGRSAGAPGPPQALELGFGLAACERLLPFFAVSANARDQRLGQRAHDRAAHPVQ